MTFAVVFRAKPHHVERLRIIVVVRVNLLSAAPLAWLAL
ncbi:hypothetical protein GL4_2915 [Methyloceanibacter caenitepidi]|uniref:Uncharacterized protein n=1 Tax=Methyloceanibacter caenitepidi TaxID=1384459 RepID=A0A0A8K5Y1_9HYPH|nr:hypothetical protein GL4_2915 [Methyloceanibacter caenitepidi]